MCKAATLPHEYCRIPLFFDRPGMTELYLPGQRWMSEAEADLGLGTVLKTDDRCVYVAFPAADTERTYAIHNAPLSRVEFSTGDQIENHEGQIFTVLESEKSAELLQYHVEDAEGHNTTLSEIELNDRIRLNRPQDKLFSLRPDKDIWFSIRHQTWLQAAEEARSPVEGLIGPRVSLIAHQLYIATEVARRQFPRVLLADEVGLGKTIEAGLIIHQMLLSERIRRVLIVVPDPLVHQWLVEMLRRFNLRFSLFDLERFDESDAENPFHAEQRVLCSLDLLTAKPAVTRAVLQGDWDMIVVDEAHHLSWTPDSSSLEYDLIEALSEIVPAVLLLTATPEQLGRAGHFARLRLLDPERFPDYQAFLDEEEDYEPVARLANKLVNGDKLNKGDRQELVERLGDESEGTPEQLINKLVDRHGTGRMLYRNTRAAIPGFPKRTLVEHNLPLPDAYASAGKHPLTPELDHAGKWTQFDPRIPWLLDTLKSLAPDKILLICANSETVQDLRDTLLAKHAVHAAMFHEGMEIVERDRAAAFFADPEEGSQLLICSEIGSEGRNFQFAHHLILFDLPLQPDLLEQRIGRLDRIGQTQTIQLHVPIMQNSPGEGLMQWYRDGLDAFSAICPAASAVYDQQADRLPKALLDPKAMNQVIEEARELTIEINQALDTGRDRLLELHSNHPEISAELSREIEARDHDPALPQYMSRYWDAFGVEHEPGPANSIVLHKGNHMLHENFPGLPANGLSITYDRPNALAHEDLAFLTWEHPMVRSAMDMVLVEDLGSATISLVSHPDFKAGMMMVEILFVLECMAPKGLEVGRFLPPTCIRSLMNQKGEDQANKFDHEDLEGVCLSTNRKLVETIIKSQKDKVRALVQLAEADAEKKSKRLITKAKKSMHQELEEEIVRLTALARVNPNVHPEEIQYLEMRKDSLGHYLDESRVRLDAVRLVVFR